MFIAILLSLAVLPTSLALSQCSTQDIDHVNNEIILHTKNNHQAQIYLLRNTAKFSMMPL